MAQSIKVMVEGGKASAGPPLGPALGPTGINVGAVVAKINEKTKAFAGMKVPVEVIIDPSTRNFDIVTGSPPVSQLFLKELKLEKLSSNSAFDKVGNLPIEYVIKIALAKMDSMNCTSLNSAVKIVIGSCVSSGLLVESLDPREATKAVNAGKFDAEIKAKKTEPSPEKLKKLADELAEIRAKIQAELEKIKAEQEAEAAAEGKAPAEAEVLAEGEAAAEGAVAAEGAAKPGEVKPGVVPGKEGAKPGAVAIPGAAAKPGGAVAKPGAAPGKEGAKPEAKKEGKK